MNRAEAEQFLQSHRQAVMATIDRNGRPQLTNVLAAYDHGRILVSITEDRAKYRNLARDPRTTLLFLGDNFWQYLTVDGTATLVRMPEALPGLREYYEAASGGPHPNWEEYDQAMRDEKRVLAIINVERMYPISS